MNFLAHYVIATRTLAPTAPLPEYVLANALPDVLPLAAPRVRLRLALLPAAPPDAQSNAAVAAGVRAHLLTDSAFHATPAFAEAQARAGEWAGEAGFTDMRARRFFVAHVLTEMALDAHLLRREPQLLEEFYTPCAAADMLQLTAWTEAVTGTTLPRLPQALARFVQSRYLRHYMTDAGVAEGFNRLCLRARQDTFTAGNEQKLVHLTGRIVQLMDDGMGERLLSETGAALREQGAVTQAKSEG